MCEKKCGESPEDDAWKWRQGNVCDCRFLPIFYFLFPGHPMWLSRIPQYLILAEATPLPFINTASSPQQKRTSPRPLSPSSPPRTICSGTRKMTGGKRERERRTYSSNSIYLRLLHWREHLLLLLSVYLPRSQLLSQHYTRSLDFEMTIWRMLQRNKRFQGL